MTEVEEDIFDIEEAMYSHLYKCQLYKNTNEDLKNVLSITNFSGKEVLSVMASADQVFSAYYLGARSVDTFDINKYAYYYFYLKKWCFIKYKNIKIPDESRKILEALELHDDSEEEKKVYDLWKEVVEYCMARNREFSTNKFLFSIPQNGWTVPYYNDEDKMAKIISSKKANFTQFNIFLPINCKKQYDIIILSNILEFMEEAQQITTISNLNSLLKRNGFIICSNVRYDKPKERKLFEENGFLYQNGINGIILTREIPKLQPVSYTYKKLETIKS